MNNHIGIDIGGTKMHMLAINDGNYFEKQVLTGFNAKIEYIKSEIDDFLVNLPYTPEGIGVAIPGIVENAAQVVYSDVLPCLNGLKAENFSSKPYKISLINDVKSALIEECTYYPDNYTISVIMSGTGIAASTKTNGKPILGAKSWAGELGLAPMMVNGEVYSVDSLSSGSAILQKSGTDLQTFLQMLERADEKALSIINDAGFYFGIAISMMINLFNPHVIVVGGSTSTYKGYMEKAIETAGKYSLRESFDLCKITSPKDMKRTVALGARRFAFENKRKK